MELFSDTSITDFCEIDWYFETWSCFQFSELFNGLHLSFGILPEIPGPWTAITIVKTQGGRDSLPYIDIVVLSELF